MKEHVTLSQASKLLGVTTRTLRQWANTKKLITVRTVGGHRRVPISEIHRLNSSSVRDITLAYCRCSTNKQAENLERQIGRVLEFCNKNGWKTELYKEIGSGLNDNRKQFNKLLLRLSDPTVARLVVEFEDRLIRFGFQIIRSLCTNYGVEIVVLQPKKNKEFEQELADDLISLIASYSGRLYGKRGGKKKRDIIT